MSQEKTAVSFDQISMRFGAVRALDRVSFNVQRGCVHGLLGANGAGKSTLLKILSGVYGYGAYTGSMQVCGQEIKLHNPSDALRRGIGYVPQEISVIPPLSVAENVYVGHLSRAGIGWINRRKLKRRARDLLEANGIHLNPESCVDVLTASQRQLVMIARALALNPAVLILDEATACLTDRETDNLFKLVCGFRQRGLTTIFVTHRLREVEILADRVTVLRDGRISAEFDRAETTHDRMVDAMVGKTIAVTAARATSVHFEENGADVLKVQGLSIPHPRIAHRNAVDDVSFSVRRGEVLGIAGAVGAGRTEVLSALYGRVPHRGRLWVEGRPMRIRSPRNAHKLGIALLTEDRKRDGLLFNLPLFKNITLSSLDRVSRMGVLNDAREEGAVGGLFKALAIRAPILEGCAGNVERRESTESHSRPTSIDQAQASSAR